LLGLFSAALFQRSRPLMAHNRRKNQERCQGASQAPQQKGRQAWPPQDPLVTLERLEHR
jgi:hypothetical protein